MFVFLSNLLITDVVSLTVNNEMSNEHSKSVELQGRDIKVVTS